VQFSVLFKNESLFQPLIVRHEPEQEIKNNLTQRKDKNQVKSKGNNITGNGSLALLELHHRRKFCVIIATLINRAVHCWVE
jgi:hypothetical protein